MNAVTLLLIFAGFSASSFLLVRFAGSLFVKYWRYLVRATDTQMRHINRYENSTTIVAAYLSLVALLCALLYLSGGSLAAVVIVLCLALSIPTVLFGVMLKRRVQLINRALPDALAQIAAAMRAGATFQSALQVQADNASSALDQEFAIVLRDCRVGVRMEEALENLAERINSEEIDLLVTAATIAQDVGGNLSDALQGLSDTIRRKIEMDGKIQSLTAQGRLQGHVVTALPFVMLLGLSIVEPDITMPIFSSLLGWMVLFVMFVLLVAGGHMIRRIVSIDI